MNYITSRARRANEVFGIEQPTFSGVFKNVVAGKPGGSGEKGGSFARGTSDCCPSPSLPAQGGEGGRVPWPTLRWCLPSPPQFAPRDRGASPARRPLGRASKAISEPRAG